MSCPSLFHVGGWQERLGDGRSLSSTVGQDATWRPAGRAKGTAMLCLDLNKWSGPGVQEMEMGVFHQRGKAEIRPRAERWLSPLRTV